MASASLSGFSMSGWNASSFRPVLPLPPIMYPPCFGKGPNFNYFMQSKILALAFLILGISFLVCFICAFLPFWFFLYFNVSDSTFGSEGLRKHTKDLGIFFYTDDEYINLLFLEKMSNRQVVPLVFKVAQVMEILSVAIVACTFVGSGILAFRKYSTVTGILFLAALGTAGALGQILMLVFSLMSLLGSANDVCEAVDPGCKYHDNLAWRNLPFWQQQRRLNQHTTPKMEANWTMYIAIIGAVLSIGGCVLLWLEGFMVCRDVSNIRYHQLREKRDLYENERPPTDFIVSPSRAGPPPLMYSGQPNYPVGPRQTFRPPPSMSGSSMQSGSMPPYVSREVDL